MIQQPSEPLHLGDGRFAAHGLKQSCPGHLLRQFRQHGHHGVQAADVFLKPYEIHCRLFGGRDREDAGERLHGLGLDTLQPGIA